MPPTVAIVSMVVFLFLAGAGVEAERRCNTSVTAVTCDHDSALTLLEVSGQEPRTVHWQVPLGDSPERGWPAVLLFHDAGVDASSMWSSVVPLNEREHHNTMAETANPRTLRTRTIADLLEAGFAVLTPQAASPAQGAGVAWQTNSATWAYSWTVSPDRQTILDLLEATANGELLFDPENLFALGTGSGGMMASRVGLEFPEFIRAIVIQSGTYATCYGVSCTLPEELPEDHPPTLFLHGNLDWVVPLWSMELYLERLEEAGVETRAVVSPWQGHGWQRGAPEEIVEWFERYLEVAPAAQELDQDQ